MRLGSLGPTELILIVVVLVLIFGASKLGDIGGALGKSVKEFKKATVDENGKPIVAKSELDTAPRVERTTETVVTSVPVAEKPAVPVTEYRPTDAPTR